MVVEAARRRFALSRVALRLVVGRYIGVVPGDLRFEYSPLGKPRLAPDARQARVLNFNLAHSHELALLAFTWDREIGVDVEYGWDLHNLEGLAAVCFSANENAVLRRTPAHQRRDVFYNGWTRKEAYIKAVGKGLTCSLKGFDVSMIPGEPAQVLRVEGEPEAAGQWAMEALAPGSGYAGAVVARGGGWRLACWQIGPD